MSSYISHPKGIGGHSWHEFTWQRMAWLYGYDYAHAVFKGVDPNTQADVARWQALGRRRSAA